MGFMTTYQPEAEARAAEDAAIRAEMAAAVANEGTLRAGAVAAEAVARDAAIAVQAALQNGQLTSMQGQVDALDATASTSGGTAVTTLTRAALAAAISSIGSDGSTMTVQTATNHGLTDGDYISISGCATSAYNVDSGAINVLSANQFTFATTVPSTPTATSGYVRTKRVLVASTTNFVANQQITVTNDQGDLHATSVSGTPSGGMITLATAVPITWIGSAKASIGNTVSTTLEEIRLARAVVNPLRSLPLPTSLRLLRNNVIFLDAEEGIDPTGVNDSSVALKAIVARVNAAGGGVILGGGPTSTYKYGGASTPGDLLFTTGNVVVDLQGATIFSTYSVRMYANGDPGVAGATGLIRNFWFLNVVIGGPSRSATNLMRGPRLDYCIDSGGKNIKLWGPTGTGFNMTCTTRCIWVDCYDYGGDPTKYVLGFLQFHTYDCSLTNCHVVGGTRAFAGYQQKGGRNNLYLFCTVKNVALPGSGSKVTTLRDGFRNRGDAPYKDSSTAYLGSPPSYPFSTLSWDVPDERRASINTFYIGCEVDDSALTAFVAQEFVGGGMVGCNAKNVRTGLKVLRSDASDTHSAESTLRITAATNATSITLQEGAGSEFNRPAVARPVTTGSQIVVELDSGAYHVSTIATPPPVGSDVVVIADPLPSQAAAGRLIYVPRETVINANAIVGATSIEVKNIGTFANGNPISIVTDVDDVVHTTTISGAPVGTSPATITLADALPAAASKGREVSLTVLGQERDWSVTDCKLESITGKGIVLFGQRNNHMTALRLHGVTVDTAGQEGISGDSVDDLLLTQCHVLNPSNDGVGSYRGIALSRCYYPRLVLNRVGDTRGTPKMNTGIAIFSSCLLPTLRDNRVYGGWTTRPILSYHAGYYSGNIPGDGWLQTTDATTQTTLFRFEMPDGQVANMEVTVIAKQTNGSNKAVYKLAGLFSCASGTVTQHGSTTTLYSVETDATWNCTLSTSLNLARINVTGAAGQNITWEAYVTGSPHV